MNRNELIKYDLEMYLTGACHCETEWHVVAVVNANGAHQYKLACVTCQKICLSPILFTKLDAETKAAAKIVRNNLHPEDTCAVCGEWRKGVELHHWAPAQAFPGDYYRWPTSLLCPDHHKMWHALIEAYYGRKNRCV